MRNWYSPGALAHYSHSHIIWILENYELFNAGIYPRESTGYTDRPGVNAKRIAHRNASTVATAEILMELTRRLSRTGQDGELVMRVFADNWEIPKLAKLVGCDEFVVVSRINRAIRYCRGPDAREADYKQFCSYERAMKRLAGSIRVRAGLHTQIIPI